jgi:hypothetical protein
VGRTDGKQLRGIQDANVHDESGGDFVGRSEKTDAKRS